MNLQRLLDVRNLGAVKQTAAKPITSPAPKPDSHPEERHHRNCRPPQRKPRQTCMFEIYCGVDNMTILKMRCQHTPASTSRIRQRKRKKKPCRQTETHNAACSAHAVIHSLFPQRAETNQQPSQAMGTLPRWLHVTIHPCLSVPLVRTHKSWCRLSRVLHT